MSRVSSPTTGSLAGRLLLDPQVRELVDVGGLGEHPEDDARAPDVDHRVGRERRLGHGVAVEQGAVGRAEVVDLGASAVPEDLDVLAGDAGVVHGDVGVGAAADHGARMGDRVALAADVEHGRPVDRALHAGGLDVDHAGGQARVLLERDRDAAGERVVLRRRVASAPAGPAHRSGWGRGRPSSRSRRG